MSYQPQKPYTTIQVTGNATLTAAQLDYDLVVLTGSVGKFTLTLPSASLLTKGRKVHFSNQSSFDVVLNIGGALVTVYNGGNNPVGNALTLACDGVNWSLPNNFLMGLQVLNGGATHFLNGAGTPVSGSAQFDAVFGSTRGTFLYRGASGWNLLSPGSSGSVLSSQGTGADPVYVSMVPQAVRVYPLTGNATLTAADVDYDILVLSGTLSTKPYVTLPSALSRSRTVKFIANMQGAATAVQIVVPNLADFSIDTTSGGTLDLAYEATRGHWTIPLPFVNYLSYQSGSSATTIDGTGTVVSSNPLLTMDVRTAAGPYSPARSAYRVVVVSQSVGAAFTLNLPSSPVNGDIVDVKDGKGDVVTNNITVSGNGKLIDGSSTYSIKTTAYESYRFQYSSTAGAWIVL